MSFLKNWLKILGYMVWLAVCFSRRNLLCIEELKNEQNLLFLSQIDNTFPLKNTLLNTGVYTISQWLINTVEYSLY